MNNNKNDLRLILPEDSYEVLLAALALDEQYEDDQAYPLLVEKLEAYFTEKGIEGYQRQIVMFEYLMDADPMAPFALNLGITYIRIKDYETAFSWLCRAKELEGARKIPQLHLYLYGAYAWGLGTEKNEEQALEVLQEFCDYLSPSDYDFYDEEERQITAMMYAELEDRNAAKGRSYDSMVNCFEAFLWDRDCEGILSKFRENLLENLKDDNHEMIMDDLFIRSEDTRNTFLEMVELIRNDQDFNFQADNLRRKVLIENRIRF